MSNLLDMVEALVEGQPVCASQLRSLQSMLLRGELVFERGCQVGWGTLYLLRFNEECSWTTRQWAACPYTHAHRSKLHRMMSRAMSLSLHAAIRFRWRKRS